MESSFTKTATVSFLTAGCASLCSTLLTTMDFFVSSLATAKGFSSFTSGDMVTRPFSSFSTAGLSSFTAMGRSFSEGSFAALERISVNMDTSRGSVLAVDLVVDDIWMLNVSKSYRPQPFSPKFFMIYPRSFDFISIVNFSSGHLFWGKPTVII